MVIFIMVNLTMVHVKDMELLTKAIKSYINSIHKQYKRVNLINFSNYNLTTTINKNGVINLNNYKYSMNNIKIVIQIDNNNNKVNHKNNNNINKVNLNYKFNKIINLLIHKIPMIEVYKFETIILIKILTLILIVILIILIKVNLIKVIFQNYHYFNKWK